MTPEEVTRRNEAIANYMGIDTIWPPKEFREGYVALRDDILIEKLVYHLDWRMLMPVLEKIALGGKSTSICIGPSTLHDGKTRSWAYVIGQAHRDSHSQNLTFIEVVWMAASDWILSREAPEKQQ